MSILSDFARKASGLFQSGAEDLLSSLGIGGGNDGVQPPQGGHFDFNSLQDNGSQTDQVTKDLYKQLLGLMDQQANTDLTNQQIGSLSDILNQQATLAGKDLAAGTFAAGGATPANIAPIQQAKSSALAQGITQIQTAEQSRVDQNRATALSLMSNLRNSMAAEDQAAFDNKMNAAIFEWQKYIDQKGLELSSEEKDASFWAAVIPIVIAAI